MPRETRYRAPVYAIDRASPYRCCPSSPLILLSTHTLACLTSESGGRQSSLFSLAVLHADVVFALACALRVGLYASLVVVATVLAVVRLRGSYRLTGGPKTKEHQKNRGERSHDGPRSALTTSARRLEFAHPSVL